MMGGYAHGLGYALYESAAYDADGSLRTASFVDYSIVSVGEVAPTPELVHISTPTDSNPEGFKGAGESGTIPVPAAISAAIEDAIRQRRIMKATKRNTERNAAATAFDKVLAKHLRQPGADR